jgi:hypothetical protein
MSNGFRFFGLSNVKADMDLGSLEKDKDMIAFCISSFENPYDNTVTEN